MIRVVVVDDHALVRAGVVGILRGAGGIEVIGEGSDGEEALRLVRTLKPDVLLLDLSMPGGMGGLEAARRLQAQGASVPILVLTVHEDAISARHALDAGARGYVTKGSDAPELLAALRKVAAGGRYLTSSIAEALAFSNPEEQRNPCADLTKRELEVVQAFARGDVADVIGERLHLSPKTVHTYKYRAMEKLGVRNLVELARMLERQGLLGDAAPVVTGEASNLNESEGKGK